jgi:lysophospholipase L1-like esterase
MSKNIKNIFFGIMTVIWFIICGEVSVRVISAVTLISDIEWQKYTSTMQEKSLNPKFPYIHKANSSARLMGVKLDFNSMGHRGKDLKKIKKENEKRVYFAGNSLLLGWGVPQEDTYAEVVGKMLQEVKGNKSNVYYQSINAGIGGYTTFHQVEIFEDQVNTIDPDMVVLQYFINDAEDKSSGGSSTIFRYSLLAATIHSFYNSIFFKATGSLEDYYSKMYENESIGWKKTKKSINKLGEICREREIPLIALFVPDFHHLSSEDPYMLIYQKIFRTFKEAQIPLFNTLPGLQEEFGSNPRKAWVSSDDVHPNTKSHKIIGEGLFEFIDSLKINEF